MDNHERKQRADHANNLLRDDVLKAAFEAVRQHCLSVMTNPAEGDEKALQARRDLLAVDRAENQLRSFVADGTLIDKKDRDR